MLPRHEGSFYGQNIAGEVWVARVEQSMERRSKAWKGIKSDIMRFWLCLAKTPIFSRHWTSLITPDTVGTMIRAVLASISLPASTFKLRPNLREFEIEKLKKWLLAKPPEPQGEG